MPYYKKEPKRDHNFENHPHVLWCLMSFAPRLRLDQTQTATTWCSTPVLKLGLLLCQVHEGSKYPYSPCVEPKVMIYQLLKVPVYTYIYICTCTSVYIYIYAHMSVLWSLGSHFSTEVHGKVSSEDCQLWCAHPTLAKYSRRALQEVSDPGR